jgi:histidyl-tRNA synthetase
VKKEMTEEKGLDPTAADRIGEYVKHKGALSGARFSVLLIVK